MSSKVQVHSPKSRPDFPILQVLSPKSRLEFPKSQVHSPKFSSGLKSKNQAKVF